MNRTSYRFTLYRGKDINGNWIYGYYFSDRFCNYIFPSLNAVYQKNKYRYSVDSDSVGQFSGLFDKDNKAIYEGDILRFLDSSHRIQFREVVFRNGCFAVEIEDTHFIPINDIPCLFRSVYGAAIENDTDSLTK